VKPWSIKTIELKPVNGIWMKADNSYPALENVKGFSKQVIWISLRIV
jgi:hypothetical protein